MWHILKYHSKALLSNHSMIFWTLLFPLVLATFFSLTLGNLTESFTLEEIPVAIVESEEYQNDIAFQEFIKQLSEEESGYLSPIVTSLDEANQLLKENEIDGFMQVKDSVSLHVNQSGMNQTILADLLTAYEQKQQQIMHMIEAGVTPAAIQEVLLSSMDFTSQSANENSDLVCVYFFALMAMTMLFGAYWSIRTSDDQLANHSAIGARNTLAPTKRSMQLAIDFLLSTLFNVVVQIIILLYLLFILQVDFGDSLPAIILVVIAGSLAGNSIGVMISAYGAKSYEANIGILTSITMTCSALAGLMMIQIKYLVQEYVPILSYINPANMITDALYAQYYYGMNARFFQNIASLLLLSLLCFGFAYARIRRKQYASI